MTNIVKKWVIGILDYHNERKRIKKWLDKYGIKYYTIKRDLTVDVSVSVDLSNKNLLEIPIQFGKVHGFFRCNGNKLTSLKGCPKFVLLTFDCSQNQLQTLEYCPETISGGFKCCQNNLTSLKFGPKYSKGMYYCNGNKLTSLEFGPEIVDGYFSCYDNEIESFKHCPKKVEAFFCSVTKINNFDDLTTDIEKVLLFKGKYFPYLHDYYSNKPPFLNEEDERDSECNVPGEWFKKQHEIKFLFEQLNNELNSQDKPFKRPKI